MKISKVNHVRTGTQVKTGNGEGIIYTNPSKKENAIEDLSKHIYDLNEKAKVLYSPLNPVKPILDSIRDKNEKENYKDAHKCFKNLVVSIVKENEKGISDSSELIKVIKNKADKNGICLDIADSISARITDKCLRKSLCSKKKIVKDLLAAIISNDKSTRIGNLDKEAIKEFFDLVHEDYYKKVQLKAIEKSIVNKDVKVQVKSGDDGEKHLVLSSADNPRKHFYFDFIKDFAVKDKAGRDEMIIRFRQLIILYCSGQEKYRLSIGSDVGVWTFGSSLPEVTENFDDEAASLIADYNDNLSKKKDIKKKIDSYSSQKEKHKFNSPDYKKLDENIQRLKDEEKDYKHAIYTDKRKIKLILEEDICNKYREAVKTEGLNNSDIFWIGYIQHVIQKQFNKKEAYNNYRISLKYLYEVVFNEWISFMALKYIDLGKAVYHFAMPDCSDIRSGKEICAGKVQPIFEDGITSFDYERIKAKETLSRDFSIYATYAAGIFSNAVADPEYRLKEDKDEKDNVIKTYEDPLQYKDEDWKEALISDAKKKILMYFGGQSKYIGTDLDTVSDIEITQALQDAINVIRNSNFHYAGSVVTPNERSVDIIKKLFEIDFSNLGTIIREKYLSNNVPVYYNIEDINKFMTYLYKGESNREAQIPSFGKILKKKDMPAFVTKNVPGNLLAKFDANELEKYRSSLYFVLKEAYYYGFLNETNLKERFIKALNYSAKDTTNPEALDNFKGRIAAIGNSCTFGEICQMLMTDYNQQNQGEYKVKSQIDSNKDEANKKGHKYSHFKMLLYVTIQKAFVEYISEKKDIYGFIKAPVYKNTFFDTDEAQKFVESWNANIFKDVKETVLNDSYCLSWYALAHMLPPKQVNQLQGEIKSYIQFVKDINRREKSVLGKEKDTSLVDNTDSYERILKVFEFIMNFVGKTSNVLTDYFTDEDDYAKHLSSYVGFVGKKEEKNNSTLSAFCNKSITKGGVQFTERIGIYHDGTNPIINNNIIRAIMYGNENILTEAVSKISPDLINGEIAKFFEAKKNLEKVFEKGECSSKEEQERLRDFQNLKNRIELHDISVFTEIINDYMAELVNMAYLRERDLMYYQLGFNYIRIEYGNIDDKYKEIKAEGINIRSGALLYQIRALYSYDLPVIYKDKEKYKYTNGYKIRRFVESYCEEDMNDLENTFMSGLELFENKKLHDELHNIRNDIDHLKYFIKPEKSLLYMYSQIYNGFFGYDIKLKKSVSYIFTNILAKYFVIANTEIKSETIDNRRFALLKIKDLESDVFTFKGKRKDKFGNDKEYRYVLPVRNKEFLNELKKIVNYKI